MIDIKHEWHGKNVRLIDIDNQVFEGRITDVTGKEDNDETNRDSLTIFNGKDYIFFSDNEIKNIEVLD
mgnify:CR=1 FL=1